MGENVEFPSNGISAEGYLASPAEGTGPGIVVIQEWWGLVPHIRDVCDRFAAEGFVALAPDLYRGETASEPDEAGKLMMAMKLDRAGKDMSGAVDFLKGRSIGSGIGVTGFCMGGGLALVLACQRPDLITAVAPFYGVIPWPEAQPEWAAMSAAVQGHYAEKDGFATPESVTELEQKLRGLGRDVEMFVYPNTEHAFFNDTRPEVYDPNAAQLAWERVVLFFRSHLG